jgi:hypothetical protein
VNLHGGEVADLDSENGGEFSLSFDQPRLAIRGAPERHFVASAQDCPADSSAMAGINPFLPILHVSAARQDHDPPLATAKRGLKEIVKTTKKN